MIYADLSIHRLTVGVRGHTAASRARQDGAGLYARVSSHDQKTDLDRQVARLSAWAMAAGVPVVRIEAEVGSGMNGTRAKARGCARIRSSPST
jgi:putative resolvase